MKREGAYLNCDEEGADGSESNLSRRNATSILGLDQGLDEYFRGRGFTVTVALLRLRGIFCHCRNLRQT